MAAIDAIILDAQNVNKADLRAFLTDPEFETAVITSSAAGALVIGDTAANHAGSMVELNRSNSQVTYTAAAWSSSDALHAGGCFFIRSRSATIGTFEETLDNDQLGEMEWFGCDSGDTLSEIAAAFRVYQDGNAGAARVPTRMEWQIGTDVADPTTRMKLQDGGLSLTNGLVLSGSPSLANATGVGSSGSGGDLRFYLNGTLRALITSVGNVNPNATGSALATTATNGFQYLPTCAGTPTGVPAYLPTGALPVVLDNSANKLWAYIGGSWKGVSLS